MILGLDPWPRGGRGFTLSAGLRKFLLEKGFTFLGDFGVIGD